MFKFDINSIHPSANVILVCKIFLQRSETVDVQQQWAKQLLFERLDFSFCIQT